MCLVPQDSIISRIYTGLVTGSFVGAVNVFVNYAHARSSYFRELAIALFEICHELGGDLVRARMRNNDLSDSTKKEIVARYKERSQVRNGGGLRDGTALFEIGGKSR